MQTSLATVKSAMPAPWAYVRSVLRSVHKVAGQEHPLGANVFLHGNQTWNTDYFYNPHQVIAAIFARRRMGVGLLVAEADNQITDRHGQIEIQHVGGRHLPSALLFVGQNRLGSALDQAVHDRAGPDRFLKTPIGRLVSHAPNDPYALYTLYRDFDESSPLPEIFLDRIFGNI